MDPQAHPKQSLTVPLIALAAAFITFIVYIPALNNGFMNWDDPAYVLDNQEIRSLDFNLLKWVFVNVVACNWHPLTVISHALDYALWGLNPWGHHLVSVLLHTFNTFLAALLVFRLLRIKFQNDGPSVARLKRAAAAALVTALLFGIHPLHVESVAWVAERKDVLSAFFFLLSVIMYIGYAAAANGAGYFHYAAALVFFALALTAKPMAMTLPFVLLILDFHPLGRLSLKFREAAGALAEKAPFFVLSAVSAMLTIWAQRAGGAVLTLDRYPLEMRIFVPVRGYIFYLYKTLFPFSLAPYYPRPVVIDYFNIEYLISTLLLISIGAVCIATFRKYRVISAAALFYLVTLLPVIGIVQVGGQAAADRYTYLPGLAPFFLIGLGAAGLFQRASESKMQVLISALAFMVFTGLGVLTIKQISIWKDPVTFWSYEIKKFPKGVPIAYINRGMAYEDKGDLREAIHDYSTAIMLSPGYADTYINRGNAFYSSGERQKALDDFNTALRLNPKSAFAYVNRSNVYRAMGKNDLALRDLYAALGINPRLAAAYHNLSQVYFDMGDAEKGAAAGTKATELGYR